MVKKIKVKNTRRREFKDTSDISRFEEELLVDGMSETEKREYGIVIDTTDPEFIKSPEYETFKKLVKLGKNLAPSMEEKKQTLIQVKGKSNFTMTLQPLIFKNKGKTFPSVPYLNVYIESALGNLETLHHIHSKTRK